MNRFLILKTETTDQRFYGTDRYGEKVTMFRVVDKHGDVWYSTVDRADAEAFVARQTAKAVS